MNAKVFVVSVVQIVSDSLPCLCKQKIITILSKGFSKLYSMVEHSTTFLLSVILPLAAFSLLLLILFLTYFLSDLDFESFIVGLLVQLTVGKKLPLDSEIKKLLVKRTSPMNGAGITVYDAVTGYVSFGLRVFTPLVPGKDQSLSVQPLPILLWIHGGGWTGFDQPVTDSFCMEIVEHSGFIVVSLDYRLAPDNKFPAAFQDSLDALQWVHKNAHTFGADPRKIFVGGDSAGANLAAAIACYNYDIGVTSAENVVPIKGLLLVYPPLEHGVYRDSHIRYGTCYFTILPLISIIWCWSKYLTNQSEQSSDYRACPMRASDKILSQFPPTRMVTAKYDILTDEGVAFAARQQANGVQVDYEMYDHTIHGFFTGFNGKTHTRAVSDSCKWMRTLA